MTDSIDRLLLLSTPVTLRCTPGPYASYLRGLLSALIVPDLPSGSVVTLSLDTDRREGPRFVGTSDGDRFVATDSAPDFVRIVLWQLDRLAAEGSGDLLLHAGVASRNGRALLVAGPSGSGKSTLVAGLMRAGFDYLSDEIACVDGGGMVQPYPRPLCLRAGSVAAFPEMDPFAHGTIDDLQDGARQVPPQAIRAGSVGVAATIDQVAFIRYRRAAPVEIRSLHRAEAVTRLLEQRLPSRLPGSQALGRLASALEGVGCWEIGFGVLDDAVATIAAGVGSTSSVST